MSGLFGQAVQTTTSDPEVEQRYFESLTLLYSGSESAQLKATQLLKKLAVGGHIRSQHMLGLMYREGFGVQMNSRQAFQWFERAADQGYPIAMLALVELILAEEDDEKRDYVSAKSWLDGVLDSAARLSVSTDDFAAYRLAKSRANYLLGLLYLNSWGVEEDKPKAVELFTVASLTGDEDASMYLAIAYAKGENVAKDTEKAKEYFDLLNLQSTDRVNRTIESEYAGSGDASDRANMQELSQLTNKEVSHTIYAMQTDFAREILNSTGDDFDAGFAATLLEMAAEGGYVEAKNQLGLLRYRGLGVEQNYEIAARLFGEAAEENWVLSQYNLAMLIRLGHFEESKKWSERKLLNQAAGIGLFAAQSALDGDEGLTLLSAEEARDLCVEKAEAGDARAVYSLANRKLIGWMVDVESDVVEIAKQYEKSAEDGYARAQYAIGVLRMTGEGVEQNYQSAFAWLRSAAFQDLPEALYFMGSCYLTGNGVPSDAGAAFRYFTKSANLGYGQAKNGLAIFYNIGLHVPKNEYKATQLFLESAGEGDAVAAQIVGNCYLEGEGVRTNVAEGLRWIAQSAEQGHLGACYQLAQIYGEDFIVARDEVEVAYWQERAAEFGDKRSMKLTAINYMQGKGSPRNRGKAAFWLESYREHPSPVDVTSLYYPGEYESNNVVQGVLPEDYSVLLMLAELRASIGWTGTNVAEARKVYETLASKGSMGAKLRLAKLHLAGDVKGASSSKAVSLLKGLYEQNKAATYSGKLYYSSEAARMLSQCYAEGNGVKANASRKISWLEASATSGHIDSQYELGEMYSTGGDVKKNMNKGVGWLLKAAQSGESRSQLHLARMNLVAPIKSLSENSIVVWLKALVDSGSGEAGMLLKKYGVKYKESERERKLPEEDQEDDEWNPWTPVKAA